MKEEEKKDFTRYNETYEVYNLEEALMKIRQFSQGELVWFRGHESCDHKLLPTLYRNTKVDFFDDYSYSSIHNAEDMRIQQYYARDYPFIKDNGNNTVEWLGMGQHFGIRTRFLDWSLSAIHSLTFALGKYINNATYEGEEIPCLWVLKPQEMNKRIVESVFDVDWVTTYKKFYAQGKDEYVRIESLLDKMQKNKEAFIKAFVESNKENKWSHMDYIYNLAYFDRLLETAKYNPAVAFTGTVVNPIFLILAMNYIDGSLTGNDRLDTMPLATIHPLNSERIREQKGVFTVFPFPSQEKYKGSGENLEYLRMEWNQFLKGTLCKIVLLRPRTICKQLKSLGVHESWLYNEPAYITKEIENGQ